MFGDMMGMMGKLKEAQAKIEAAKKRLETVMIEEKSSGDYVKVVISASRKIQSIEIDPEITEDKEVLEDYLILTLNKAIAKATELQEKELAAVAKEGMPNIPGMDLFK